MITGFTADLSSVAAHGSTGRMDIKVGGTKPTGFYGLAIRPAAVVIIIVAIITGFVALFFVVTAKWTYDRNQRA